jgi:hypothetical protein
LLTFLFSRDFGHCGDILGYRTEFDYRRQDRPDSDLLTAIIRNYHHSVIPHHDFQAWNRLCRCVGDLVFAELMLRPDEPELQVTTAGGQLSSSPATRPVHYLYFILNEDARMVKIGFSTSPEARRRDLNGGNHLRLILVHKLLIQGDQHAVKSSCHRHFQRQAVHGEWFNFTEEMDSWRKFREIHESPSGIRFRLVP